MADKRLGILSKTEAGEDAGKEQPKTAAARKRPGRKSADKVKARGIGLKTSEWAKLEEMAAEMDTSAHTLVMFAVRKFIKDFDEGYRPPTETRRSIKMPE